MILKAPVPHLMRGGNRLSGEIMLTRGRYTQTKTAERAARRFSSCAKLRNWSVSGLRRETSQHVLQDAAVLEVLHLVERIDAGDQRNALQAEIGRDDLGD